MITMNVKFFKVLGPHSPDLTMQELENELILFLSNSTSSNGIRKIMRNSILLLLRKKVLINIISFKGTKYIRSETIPFPSLI